VPAGLPGAEHGVLLIRHGETEWSVSKQHTSHTDLPLTSGGEADAVALRPILAGLLAAAPAALLLSSPLQRAARTADLAGLSVEYDKDLIELDYGEYEGLTSTEIRRASPGWAVWTGPTPGGELLSDAAARVDRVIDRARAATARGPVVLVAHGHILRILTARWLGLDPTDGRLFALDTATLSTLGTEHDKPVIRQWNVPARGLR
jgi:probable phosphoglycerate mutase